MPSIFQAASRARRPGRLERWGPGRRVFQESVEALQSAVPASGSVTTAKSLAYLRAWFPWLALLFALLFVRFVRSFRYAMDMPVKPSSDAGDGAARWGKHFVWRRQGQSPLRLYKSVRHFSTRSTRRRKNRDCSPWREPTPRPGTRIATNRAQGSGTLMKRAIPPVSVSRFRCSASRCRACGAMRCNDSDHAESQGPRHEPIFC